MILLRGLGMVDLIENHLHIDLKQFFDKAQVTAPGGIDLTSNKFLQTNNSGGSIKFHLDPGMLQQLQNASGFVPVIINIQPMTDLRGFLGLANR